MFRNARPLRSVSSGWAIGLVLVGSLLATQRAEAQRRGRGDDAELGKRTVDELVSKLEPRRASIERVLSGYNRMELSQAFDIFVRHDAHRRILEELRKYDTEDLAKIAQSDIGKRRHSKRDFASNVVLMKALIGKSFPMPEAERIELLLNAARSSDERLSVWAIRLLVDSGWSAAIDALIALLREEEDASRHLEDLAVRINLELYRALGSRAIGSSGAIEKNWKELGRKLPKEVDYSPSDDGGNTTFFGDRIALRSVFAIDISSSMRAEVTLRSSKGRTSSKEEKEGRKEPKIEIVRRELLRALGGLAPENRFNIVPYDGTARVWLGQSLLQASTAVVARATEFARTLETGSGTNIHDAMVMSLEVPDVETVYLLSDGAPSRGGGPEEIIRRVNAMNYLRGARVVTYGFTGASAELMKQLADDNWGWFRALD